MTVKTATFTLIVGLLTACSPADTSDSDLQYVKTPYSDPCIKPSLTAPDAVKADETFSASISVTNECDEPRTIPVEGSNPANLLVVTKDNKIVWSLYEFNGTRPALPASLETLQPGENLDFDVSRRGSDASKPIPVGTYDLVGLLTIVDETSTKPYKDFEVVKSLTITP